MHLVVGVAMNNDYWATSYKSIGLFFQITNSNSKLQEIN